MPRRILASTALLIAALRVLAADETDSNAKAVLLTAPRQRPSLFVTASPVPGLRSIVEVRDATQRGQARKLWAALLEKVNRERREPVVTPMIERDGQRVLGNRPFDLVAQAAQRILEPALVALILDDRAYVDASLAQIMALFDQAQWPEWADQVHLNAGLNASLRHGQLVVPVALAFDWMYHLLTSKERRAIVDGLDRCAITPYKRGYAAREGWSRRHSNWMTVVLGGFGIAGMALGADHKDSAMLVANALPAMKSYLDALGPEGEFNESVQYAGSMYNVVYYFSALRYASRGRDNPFERHSLRSFYEWYQRMTFPPGRVAGFGDPDPDMPPVVAPAAAVAAALHDPLIQGFYEQYCDQMLESPRNRALEFLSYDANLEAASPAGRLSLGKAYHGHGKLISSRATWDPVSTPSVVYAKAGREPFHGHADWGQVCIDGYGQRLVVDLKSPYPKDSQERYYSYQQFGHNVFVFGENDTGGVSWREKDRQGRTTWSVFDDARGGAWTMDLSPVYGEGYSVTRTVVHLLPCIVVVLDEAILPGSMPISLRWHLAAPAEPAHDGSFRLAVGDASLSARMMRLDGEAELAGRHHAYVAPYNKRVLGEDFEQRHEPYIELKAKDAHCRVLSLFTLQRAGEKSGAWRNLGDRAWAFETLEGRFEVRLEQKRLSVLGSDGRSLQAPL